MKFRYDINALRAIAVVGVVLFHFKVPYFEGGFSGVDIFYVISGYLMTRIIINSMAAGNFSVREFYVKRMQRIIPALLALILVLLVSCFFIYLPKDYQLVAKNSTASLLFLSNILYWTNSGYFDTSSDSNILLHTWSLSVEWQFYLILPLVLLFLNKIFRNDKVKFLLFFSISVFLIFIGSIIATKVDPSASFYLLPTRSWEMLLGGTAFLVEGFNIQKNRKGIAIAGYLVLLACLVMLNDRLNWPGFYTLLPVIATFVIIVCNYNEIKLLETNIVQTTGKISYSLYLWHWPVYVISNYIGIKATIGSSLLLISISVVLAYLSYKYIESLKFNSGVLLRTSVVACACTAFLTIKSSNDWLFNSQTIEISNYRENHESERRRQFRTDSCYIYDKHTGLVDYDMAHCLEIQDGKKNVLLLGDSHAAHFSQSMREMFEKKNIHLSQASASGCLPLIKKNGAERCSEVIEYIYNEYLPKNSKRIDGVILSANWANVPEKEYVDLVDDLEKTIQYLKSIGINTIIIGQNEVYTLPYPSISAREHEFNVKTSNNFLKQGPDLINKYLSRNLHSFYINIYNLDSIPRLSSHNIPYMFDENHFTKYGADLITEKIMSDKLFVDFIN